MAQFYLNPVGLLYGAVAKEAIDQGMAGRLAGGKIGFCSVQLMHGDRGMLKRQLLSYRQARLSKEKAVVKALHRHECARPMTFASNQSGPLLMGVVNVTPDSFSDGGDFRDASAAIAQGQALLSEGADILDIGGESTRPGARPICADEELARVIPVIQGLAGGSRVLSIDTRKPEVMRQAVAAGAGIVNDVTALTFSEKSAEVAKDLDRPVILMHAQGDPQTMQDNPVYENVVIEVFDWLAQRIEVVAGAGLAYDRLLIDPGIGFGKNLGHNLELLAHLAFFHGLGVPVVLGASRKRFIGELAQVPEAKQRMPGSVAAALKAAANAVQVIRVHDVAQTRQALSINQEIQAI